MKFYKNLNEMMAYLRKKAVKLEPINTRDTKVEEVKKVAEIEAEKPKKATKKKKEA